MDIKSNPIAARLHAATQGTVMRTDMETLVLFADALKEIRRLHDFGVRMLMVHEHRTRDEAEVLIKVVDVLPIE